MHISEPSVHSVANSLHVKPINVHLEVAVAAPITTTLTYCYPAKNAEHLSPGIRLLVPLGRRQVTGYLLAITPEQHSEYTIRPITDQLDRQPLFPKSMIPFFRWIASYYRYPIGEVIKNALPGGMTPQSGRRVLLTEQGKNFLTDFLHSNPDTAPAWMADLLDKGQLNPARTRTLWRKKRQQKELETWQEKGCLIIENIVTASTSKAKVEICVGLSNQADCHFSDNDTLKKSEKKTLTLLSEMISQCATAHVPRKELNKSYSGAGKAIKTLAEKKLVYLTEQQVFRDPFGEQPPHFSKPASLTAEQQAVLLKINPAIKQKKFSTFLLHGVTGSGKTEVYLQAAENALQEKRTVLILVPEIALASQLEAHFFSRFGRLVALLHSGLSTGERFDQWQHIARGEARIVIGARSAIFAPLSSPGLIIVDEEHDGAYKQEDSFRYQARDMAVLRGKLQDCTVILGSATPSLASFHNSNTGKYRTLTMAKRIEDRPLPTVSVIDLRSIKKEYGSLPFFSETLFSALAKNLDQGNQSIIFLNRRGYASLMLCQDCGTPVRCRHCNISLTLHKGSGKLCCHYCGFTAQSAIICPSCQSARVKELGFGTERIEEELQKRFPEARIARLDRDTSTNRKQFIKILKAVHNQEVDILVGTQMITKGHHFPHVTLVGVIWADAGLGMPDFRAGERTFQLISQVTGRAGRGDKPGQVIIQTHQPDHYAVTCAQQHDYSGFAEKEMQLRGALQFPPFSRLVNLRFSGENEEQVKRSAQVIGAQCRRLSGKFGIDVLGPASAPLSKIRDRYRWQLLLKAADSASLHTLCDTLLAAPPDLPATVRMSIDVDPENML